ncbi:unnamed protein product [Cochlearia groenlandica]
MNLSHKGMFMIVYFVYLLISSSCTTATARNINGPLYKVSEVGIFETRSSRHENMDGFRFKSRVIHVLSRRVLVPPSGPSKRHNSVVDNLKN